MLRKKIKIAVSSCLLGEAVRYDGTDKEMPFITQQLAKEYNLISLCPEMAIGLGVPRPPIHLVECEAGVQVLRIDKPSENLTKALLEYGSEIIQSHPDLCGYIFKKNSPSCGTKKVKVLNEDGEYERRGIGMYAAAIIKELPSLPIIDEEDLLNENLKLNFISSVVEYSKSQNAKNNLS
jgi:uncharacterized protein YbbK (DUF523 family)